MVDIRGAAHRPAAETRSADQVSAPASPSVRRLARELGVDITKVQKKLDSAKTRLSKEGGASREKQQ